MDQMCRVTSRTDIVHLAYGRTAEKSSGPLFFSLGDGVGARFYGGGRARSVFVVYSLPLFAGI